MKQIFLPGVLLLASIPLFAQQMDHLWVVASGGGLTQTTAGSLQWTTGEWMIAPRANTSLYWGEGFQQSELLLLVSTRETKPAKLLPLHVYPNPSADFLFLESKTPLSAQLYDLSGRPLGSLVEVNGSTKFDLRNLPGGLYLLHAFNRDGSLVGVAKIQHIR